MFLRTLSCSPGIGVEPQQAEKPPIPPLRKSEVFGVCITNALLAGSLAYASAFIVKAISAIQYR